MLAWSSTIEKAWLAVVLIGFGAAAQTFFWGIAGPTTMERLGIGPGAFASVIGAATLTAALLYIALGQLVAKFPGEKALAVGITTAGAALLAVAFSPGVGVFALAFALLRLGGRHVLSHAVELRLSEGRERLSRFGAHLVATAYPISILIVAPTLVVAASVVSTNTLLVAIGIVMLVAGCATFVVASRSTSHMLGSSGCARETASLVTILAEPRFALLTVAYCVPFTIDSVALLFHTALAPSIGSVPVLTLYACGQIAGSALARWTTRHFGTGWLVAAQAPPLFVGAVALGTIRGAAAAPIFFGALGLALAISNYAAVASWQATFGHYFLRTALVLRGVLAMAAGAVAPAPAGRSLEFSQSIAALPAVTLVLAAIAGACGISIRRLGPRRDDSARIMERAA